MIKFIGTNTRSSKSAALSAASSLRQSGDLLRYVQMNARRLGGLSLGLRHSRTAKNVVRYLAPLAAFRSNIALSRVRIQIANGPSVPCLQNKQEMLRALLSITLIRAKSFGQNSVNNAQRYVSQKLHTITMQSLFASASCVALVILNGIRTNQKVGLFQSLSRGING